VPGKARGSKEAAHVPTSNQSRNSQVTSNPTVGSSRTSNQASIPKAGFKQMTRKVEQQAKFQSEAKTLKSRPKNLVQKIQRPDSRSKKPMVSGAPSPKAGFDKSSRGTSQEGDEYQFRKPKPLGKQDIEDRKQLLNQFILKTYQEAGEKQAPQPLDEGRTDPFCRRSQDEIMCSQLAKSIQDK